ncbi:hypothetical protein K438DRAFT_1174269 [Mycena galopus ATCC 62051]|nr:hypothetical protein K438DRAFT_1174269 [Mycena galopus ATCC 62051]
MLSIFNLDRLGGETEPRDVALAIRLLTCHTASRLLPPTSTLPTHRSKIRPRKLRLWAQFALQKDINPAGDIDIELELCLIMPGKHAWFSDIYEGDPLPWQDIHNNQGGGYGRGCQQGAPSKPGNSAFQTSVEIYGSSGGRGHEQDIGGPEEGHLPVLNYEIEPLQPIDARFNTWPSSTNDHTCDAIDWYSPSDFSQGQRVVFSVHQPGTGEWLLGHETFNKWKSGEGRFYGVPG